MRPRNDLGYCPICGNDLGNANSGVHGMCRLDIPARASEIRHGIVAALATPAGLRSVIIRQPKGKRSWDDLAKGE